MRGLRDFGRNKAFVLVMSAAALLAGMSSTSPSAADDKHGLTFGQCQSLKQTRDNLPAIYLQNLASMGDVAKTQHDEEAILARWEDKLASASDGSWTQLSELNAWVWKTVVVEMKSSILWATDWKGASGVGGLGSDVVDGLMQHKSARDAVGVAVTKWLHVQYRDGAVDFQKTIEAIALRATNVDKLIEHEAERKQLIADYRQLIAMSRANLKMFVARGNALRNTDSQLGAYGAQVDDALKSDCSWAFASDPCGAQAAVARRAEKRKEIDAMLAKAAELRRRGPDTKSNDESLAHVRDQANALDVEAQAKLDTLAKAIHDLQKEKAAALDELRRGLFCSKCRRTATEIEHQEHVAFHTHLGNVKGTAVPASAEEIAERAAQYDDRIAEASAALEQASTDYAGRYQDISNRYAAAQQERAKVFERWRAEILRAESDANQALATADADYQRDKGRAEQCRVQ